MESTAVEVMEKVMTAEEARECIEKINSNLQNTRSLLYDLHERRGWDALGYANWRECVLAEFKGKQSYLYYQLAAAKVEKNISTIVENVPESHLRPLTRLKPEKQAEAWQEAVETAPEGRVTAAHIQSVVDNITGIKAGDGSGRRMFSENDSSNLFKLKTAWEAASERDRKKFIKWIDEHYNILEGRNAERN